CRRVACVRRVWHTPLPTTRHLPPRSARPKERESLGHLFLETGGGVAIVLVSSRERKRRQPGLAAHSPEFVGRLHLVGRVEGSEIHFDFVPGASENRRAAAGTKNPPGMFACFALDRHCVF